MKDEGARMNYRAVASTPPLGRTCRMRESATNSRNEALEFARRARQNLEFIEEAVRHQPDADVYVVTQLTLSLLGMVVFPKEKLLLEKINTTAIDTLTDKGWPTWKIFLDDDSKKPTRTLGRLLDHIRNSVAHGRITFTSDSPHMNEVALLVEDRWKPNLEPYWCAEIGAVELKIFCHRFLDFIDETIG